MQALSSNLVDGRRVVIAYDGVVTATIAAATSVVTVVVTQYLQRKREDARALRDQRLNYYRDLLAAIANIVPGHASIETLKQYAFVTNLAPLYASSEVLAALFQYRDAVAVSATAEFRESQHEKLTVLVDAIRKDLTLGDPLSARGLRMLLWSGAPPGDPKA